MTASVAGLYAVTRTPARAQARLLEEVHQALLGGARVVQLRDKDSPWADRLACAVALNALCRRHGALFLVNDDVTLAELSGAHGVHLGRDDTPVSVARARLGARAVIGASCYNRLDLARRAVDAGASYVAFGRFFPSNTKPQAVQAHPDLLRRAQPLGVPVVAIGGITVDNGAALVAAGAHALAVVGGLFDADDIAARARQFSELFSKTHG